MFVFSSLNQNSLNLNRPKLRSVSLKHVKRKMGSSEKVTTNLTNLLYNND